MVENVAVVISAVIALFVSVILITGATMIVHRLTDRWHRAGRSAALQITELLRLR
jgi:Flp pilus assembly pilin Flp